MGQKITLHERVEVICLTKKRLYSRDGTMRIVSRVRDSVKVMNPSSIIGKVLPLALQIMNWEEGL